MATTKQVVAKLKFRVPAGKATPAPPVASLAQHGCNMMEFVNAFNEQTKGLGDALVPVKVTVFEDRTFSFEIRSEPAAVMIRKVAGIEKGSGVSNKTKVGKLTRQQVTDIAAAKMPDLNANDPEAAFKVIAGTARSMGVEVEK